MITAVDTNVIVALWDDDQALNSLAQASLDMARERGELRIAAPVFCELAAAPRRTAQFVDEFLRDTGIKVDWLLQEAVWRNAAEAFRGYAARRRKHRDAGPRRILADFLIGAHAQECADRLLTMDTGLYRTSFPALVVEIL